MGADAGHRRFQPRRVARERSAASARRPLEAAGAQSARRRRRSPSSAWNTDQPFSHSACVSASKTPAPAAGSATKPRCDSSSRMSCVLRASRRASASGRPRAWRERQHADAVGAAEPGGERGRRAAHHVDVRVARAHRPPGAFGVDARRRGAEAASLRARVAHIRRSARNFARVTNWSASAVRRNAIAAAAASREKPLSPSARK